MAVLFMGWIYVYWDFFRYTSDILFLEFFTNEWPIHIAPISSQIQHLEFNNAPAIIHSYLFDWCYRPFKKKCQLNTWFFARSVGLMAWFFNRLCSRKKFEWNSFGLWDFWFFLIPMPWSLIFAHTHEWTERGTGNWTII